MTAPVVEKIELRQCTLSIYADNIVLMKVKADAEIDIESATEITKNVLELTNHQPFKIIVDASNVFGTFKSDAREHFATTKKYNRLRLKSAVIVDNLPVRLLVNFYQKIHLKKRKDFKVVKNFEEALGWIKS